MGETQPHQELCTQGVEINEMMMVFLLFLSLSIRVCVWLIQIVSLSNLQIQLDQYCCRNKNHLSEKHLVKSYKTSQICCYVFT